MPRSHRWVWPLPSQYDYGSDGRIRLDVRIGRPIDIADVYETGNKIRFEPVLFGSIVANCRYEEDPVSREFRVSQGLREAEKLTN